MQLEEKDLTSNVISGCAPIDWALNMARDFFSDIGDGIMDIWSDIKIKVGNFIAEKLAWIFEGWGKIKRSLDQAIDTIVAIGSPILRCGAIAAGVAVGVIAGPKILGVATLISGATAWLGASGVSGFIGSTVVALSAGLILRSIVRASTFIYNFNWNISDAAIAAQQKAAINNFYTVVGGALGESLGGLVCGAGSIAFVSALRISPGSMAKVQKLIEISGGPDGFEKSGEFIQESVEALFPIVQVGTNTLMRLAFLSTYKNIRRMIKAIAKKPALAAVLPDNWEKAIAAWGSGEAWSFKKYIEDRIEALPDGLEQFTEEFYEEFLERCRESVLQVAAVAG